MPSSKLTSQALFQQTLADVLRKLRSASSSISEEELMPQIMEDIRKEIVSPTTSVKVVAIQKVLFFSMLGYSPEFSFFPIVEVMADRHFGNKRIAYMAASLIFTEHADVIPLTTGLLLRDLQSGGHLFDQELALGFLSNICTPDLARDVVSYVVQMLDPHRYPPALRKKAVMCLYKLFLDYPEALRLVYLQLKDKIDDTSESKDDDPGVRSAVVCVLCELVRRMPATYLGLAVPLYSLLSTIEGNWGLIKVIKMFAYLLPHEPRLVKKLTAPFEKLLSHTKAASVKYECYRTIASTDLATVPSLAGFAVDGMKVFLESRDQNLRFMGLEAISLLALRCSSTRHGNNVTACLLGLLQPLREAVLRCLEDEDLTIRRKAALILRETTRERELFRTVVQLARSMYRVGKRKVSLICEEEGRERRLENFFGVEEEEKAKEEDEMFDGVVLIEGGKEIQGHSDVGGMSARPQVGMERGRSEWTSAHSQLTKKWLNEVVGCVVDLVRRQDYAHLADVEWYLTVLLKIFQQFPFIVPAADFRVGSVMREEVIQLVVRVPEVRSTVVDAFARGIFLSPPFSQRIVPSPCFSYSSFPFSLSPPPPPLFSWCGSCQGDDALPLASFSHRTASVGTTTPNTAGGGEDKENMGMPRKDGGGRGGGVDRRWKKRKTDLLSPFLLSSHSTVTSGWQVMDAAAVICGEYYDFADVLESAVMTSTSRRVSSAKRISSPLLHMCEGWCHPSLRRYPPSLQCSCLWALGKLLSKLLCLTDTAVAVMSVKTKEISDSLSSEEEDKKGRKRALHDISSEVEDIAEKWWMSHGHQNVLQYFATSPHPRVSETAKMILGIVAVITVGNGSEERQAGRRIRSEVWDCEGNAKRKGVVDNDDGEEGRSKSKNVSSIFKKENIAADGMVIPHHVARDETPSSSSRQDIREGGGTKKWYVHVGVYERNWFFTHRSLKSAAELIHPETSLQEGEDKGDHNVWLFAPYRIAMKKIAGGTGTTPPSCKLTKRRKGIHRNEQDSNENWSLVQDCGKAPSPGNREWSETEWRGEEKPREESSGEDEGVGSEKDKKGMGVDVKEGEENSSLGTPMTRMTEDNDLVFVNLHQFLSPTVRDLLILDENVEEEDEEEGEEETEDAEEWMREIQQDHLQRRRRGKGRGMKNDLNDSKGKKGKQGAHCEHRPRGMRTSSFSSFPSHKPTFKSFVYSLFPKGLQEPLTASRLRDNGMNSVKRGREKGDDPNHHAGGVPSSSPYYLNDRVDEYDSGADSGEDARGGGGSVFSRERTHEKGKGEKRGYIPLVSSSTLQQEQPQNKKRKNRKGSEDDADEAGLVRQDANFLFNSRLPRPARVHPRIKVKVPRMTGAKEEDLQDWRGRGRGTEGREEAEGEEEEEMDVITRRLRHVDVRRALTEEDALPRTAPTYEELFKLAEEKKRAEAAEKRRVERREKRRKRAEVEEEEGKEKKYRGHPHHPHSDRSERKKKRETDEIYANEINDKSDEETRPKGREVLPSCAGSFPLPGFLSAHSGSHSAGRRRPPNSYPNGGDEEDKLNHSDVDGGFVVLYQSSMMRVALRPTLPSSLNCCLRDRETEREEKNEGEEVKKCIAKEEGKEKEKMTTIRYGKRMGMAELLTCAPLPIRDVKKEEDDNSAVVNPLPSRCPTHHSSYDYYHYSVSPFSTQNRSWCDVAQSVEHLAEEEGEGEKRPRNRLMSSSTSSEEHAKGNDENPLREQEKRSATILNDRENIVRSKPNLSMPCTLLELSYELMVTFLPPSPFCPSFSCCFDEHEKRRKKKKNRHNERKGEEEVETYKKVKKGEYQEGKCSNEKGKGSRQDAALCMTDVYLAVLPSPRAQNNGSPHSAVFHPREKEEEKKKLEKIREEEEQERSEEKKNMTVGTPPPLHIPAIFASSSSIKITLHSVPHAEKREEKLKDQQESTTSTRSGAGRRNAEDGVEVPPFTSSSIPHSTSTTCSFLHVADKVAPQQTVIAQCRMRLDALPEDLHSTPLVLYLLYRRRSPTEENANREEKSNGKCVEGGVGEEGRESLWSEDIYQLPLYFYLPFHHLRPALRLAVEYMKSSLLPSLSTPFLPLSASGGSAQEGRGENTDQSRRVICANEVGWGTVAKTSLGPSGRDGDECSTSPSPCHRLVAEGSVRGVQGDSLPLFSSSSFSSLDASIVMALYKNELRPPHEQHQEEEGGQGRRASSSSLSLSPPPPPPPSSSSSLLLLSRQHPCSSAFSSSMPVDPLMSTKEVDAEEERKGTTSSRREGEREGITTASQETVSREEIRKDLVNAKGDTENGEGNNNIRETQRFSEVIWVDETDLLLGVPCLQLELGLHAMEVFPAAMTLCSVLITNRATILTPSLMMTESSSEHFVSPTETVKEEVYKEKPLSRELLISSLPSGATPSMPSCTFGLVVVMILLRREQEVKEGDEVEKRKKTNEDEDRVEDPHPRKGHWRKNHERREKGEKTRDKNSSCVTQINPTMTEWKESKKFPSNSFTGVGSDCRFPLSVTVQCKDRSLAATVHRHVVDTLLSQQSTRDECC